MNVTLKVKKLYPHAILPTKANYDDAGLDLYFSPAVSDPNKPWKDDWYRGSPYDDYIRSFETGISVELEPAEYFLKIFGRSGLASKGIEVLGGVIDPGYRGHIMVVLKGRYRLLEAIRPGDRIAQFAVLPLISSKVEEVSELSDSLRGEKGFGSSGK